MNKNDLTTGESAIIDVWRNMTHEQHRAILFYIRNKELAAQSEGKRLFDKLTGVADMLDNDTTQGKR